MFFALVACRPDPEPPAHRPPPDEPQSSPSTSWTSVPEDSADSADSGSGCGPPPPVAITAMSVTCDDQGFVTFEVDSDGVPARGMVFAMETANQPPWSEEHDLWLSGSDPCGSTATVEMRVVTQSHPDAPFYERDLASLFTCEGHFEEPAVMTYAFALGAGGALADCVVAGADPEGLRDGLYDDAMIIAPSFDLGRCRLGEIGR